MKSKLHVGIAIAILVTGNAFGVEVSRYFSNDMVLQREKPVKIWGTGKSGEKVTVSFAGQTKTATAGKDGKWVVALDPMPANDRPQTLTVESSIGNRKSSIGNVLVGDVWFFGRQTYVDISLGRTDEGREAAAGYRPTGNFRAIAIKTAPAKTPLSDLTKEATAGWARVDGKNALAMSGSAFYLGKDLAQELGVPVGIVDVNMNHYFAVGWMSEKAIADSVTMYPNDKDLPWLSKGMRERLKEREELDKANGEWEKDSGKPYPGLHPLNNPMYPSVGYNAIINPLKNATFKGVLLQLGNDYPFIAYREVEKEGILARKDGYDAGWCDNYLILKLGYRITPVTLPYVPRDWRRTWGDKTLPIGLILPPASDLDVYAAHNREIREMHRRTAGKAEGIGLILPDMKNIPSSGQPADDKLLADRCKQWVLGSVAGKDGVTATGPLFDRVEARLSKATIHFKEGTADGLKAIGDALDFFETAGPDRQFMPAKAKVDGSTIKLRSDGPVVFVRYNWNYKPDAGLVNSAGLPALPFSTDDGWQFAWIPPPENPMLPPEYGTTADKWSKSDVAIINGQIAGLEGGDSAPIPIKPGPIGMSSAPFGPNIIVIGVDGGTPASGNLMVGDVIYAANGKIFKSGPGIPYDEQYRDLAAAITYSETDEAEGKLVLSLRRGTKLMDVELQLRVLGSYSSTTPYYCEKSENIVKNAEAWSSRRYRPESGPASAPGGMLGTDLIFLLAAGTPEHQGLVRRAVYARMAQLDPKPVTPGMRYKPWNSGYTSLLLGEYFHATGDRNVLPYLKFMADLSAESQLKPPSETLGDWEAAQSDAQVGGWRQNSHTAPDRWKSGYGLMPHAGMPCVMGMQYAKEAGLKIDELALSRGLNHFRKGRAEFGSVIYSYSGSHRTGPPAPNPEAEAAGKLWSMNGKLGTAAALYRLVEDNGPMDICARHCVYGYNNTRHGHGGMFFNNFWTPIGAWAGGERAFKHFMKGQMWWRELFRRHDGAFNQAGRGGVGVSYALPYVAPKKRLRILGAPRSAFGTNCPDYLKPALEAHAQRDYARCEELIREQMDGILPAADMPVVNHLLASVRILRASIEHDLAYTEHMLKEGKHYYASLELPQLEGVVAADNPRLTTIVGELTSADGQRQIEEQRRACDIEKRKMDAERRAAAAKPATPEKWMTLIAQRYTGRGAAPANARPADNWQVKIVEHIDHAPKGWTDPKFDASSWETATVPLSWTMYHTALFRGKFTLADKKDIDGLRVKGNFFQQKNVVIYLNGELVAKVDNLGRGLGINDARLTDYAMKLLKKGENTIAISSRHNRRWGSYRGKRPTAATVSFWVEGRDLLKRP